MAAIHIPGFSRIHESVTPIIDQEPHWIDLTTSADNGFAERSASYLISVGYTEAEVRNVLVTELDVAIDDVDAIMRSISNRELQSA